MNDLDLGPTARDWVPAIAAPYQEAVRQLTAENRSLREQLAAEVRTHAGDVKVLKAQLREGLTPELLALRGDLQRWRSRATTAESRLNAMRGGSA